MPYDVEEGDRSWMYSCSKCKRTCSGESKETVADIALPTYTQTVSTAKCHMGQLQDAEQCARNNDILLSSFPHH